MSIVLEALEKAQREKERGSVSPETIVLNRPPITRLKTGSRRKRFWLLAEIKQKRVIVGAALLVAIANILFLNWWLQRNDSVFSININPSPPQAITNDSKKTPATQTVTHSAETAIIRQDPGKPPRIKVTGIVWDMQEPIALVNGKFIKKGDMISGTRVEDIKLNKVIFSYKDKNFSVSVD